MTYARTGHQAFLLTGDDNLCASPAILLFRFVSVVRDPFIPQRWQILYRRNRFIVIVAFLRVESFYTGTTDERFRSCRAKNATICCCVSSVVSSWKKSRKIGIARSCSTKIVRTVPGSFREQIFLPNPQKKHTSLVSTFPTKRKKIHRTKAKHNNRELAYLL